MAGIGALMKRFGGSAAGAADFVAGTATTAAAAVAATLKTDPEKRMQAIHAKLKTAQADLAQLEAEHREAAFVATAADDADGSAGKRLAAVHEKVEEAVRRVADLEAALVVARERVEQAAVADREAQRKAKVAELEKLAVKIQKAAEQFDEHRTGLGNTLLELGGLVDEVQRVGGIHAAGSVRSLEARGRELTKFLAEVGDPAKRRFFGPRCLSLAEQAPSGAHLARNAGLTGKEV